MDADATAENDTVRRLASAVARDARVPAKTRRTTVEAVVAATLDILAGDAPALTETLNKALDGLRALERTEACRAERLAALPEDPAEATDGP